MAGEGDRINDAGFFTRHGGESFERTADEATEAPPKRRVHADTATEE